MDGAPGVQPGLDQRKAGACEGTKARGRQRLHKGRGMATPGQPRKRHMGPETPPFGIQPGAVNAAAHAVVQVLQGGATLGSEGYGLTVAPAKDLGPAQPQHDRRGPQVGQGVVKGLGRGVVDLAQKDQRQVQVVGRHGPTGGQPVLKGFEGVQGLGRQAEGNEQAHAAGCATGRPLGQGLLRCNCWLQQR